MFTTGKSKLFTTTKTELQSCGWGSIFFARKSYPFLISVFSYNEDVRRCIRWSKRIFIYIYQAGTHLGHRCFDSTQKQSYSTRQIYRRSRRYTYKSYEGSKETPCCALHLNKIAKPLVSLTWRSKRLFCVLKNFLKRFQNRVPKGCLSVGTSEGVKKTTPKRSATLRCILTTEYTGTKDFISDDSPKVGTPRPTFLRVPEKS